MTDQEKSEASHIAGSRAAWFTMLKLCLVHLGIESLDSRRAANLTVEREEACAALRRVCAGHGDLDWDESLHLADVIEKHLAPHLDSRR
jgi:hypothetical protein